ncbi:MAG TPA: TonB-dependent receptor [Bacteroidales bacterium]|nr:TonB-dependent receptor [Bacteroidales bacterium]
MKKVLLFFCLLLVTGSLAIGQTLQVSGTVTSSGDGQPIPGVSVTVKGTTLGALTGADGKYTINVPSNAQTLMFSFIGFRTQEVKLTGSNKVDVVLEQDVFKIDEVVVIAYGTQQKRDVTGSVASVKGDEIKTVPVQSFDQALQGKAAGVAITLPNGVLNNPPVIRVRGINSITGSSYPLIVVDGVPIATGSFGGTAKTNTLADINPSDIASMDILKDASATALYGSRAANGVILITTKHGVAGKVKVTYDGYVGVTQPTHIFDVMNAAQYIEEKNVARVNRYGASPPGGLITPLVDAQGNTIDTKWWKHVYQNGLQHNHALTVSGATQSTNYFLSVGYSDQKGILKTNEYTRKNARLNIDQKITKYLKVGVNLGYTEGYTTSPQTGGDYSTGGAARLAFVLPPVIAAKLNDGSWNIDLVNNGIGNMGEPTGVLGYYNPDYILKYNYFNTATTTLISSVYAVLNVVKGLELKTQWGLDNITTNQNAFLNPIQGDGQSSNGDIWFALEKFHRWNWTNTANYTTTFADKFNLGLLAGMEEQRTLDNSWTAEKQNVNDPFFTTYQGSWSNPLMGGGGSSENFYVSYFGRASFNFDKKYYLEGSVRRDGFSGLAAGKKFGTFYGASAMWDASKEAFIQNSLGNIFSDLRLKVSYGRVGNISAVGDFTSLFTYGSGLYADQATLAFNQAGNANLKWETSDKYDGGLSFSLLKDRIQTQVNYYYNNINGLVLAVPQAPSKGIPGNSISANVGSMYNTGVELTVTSFNITKTNFSWSTTLNISTLKNKVTALAPGVDNVYAYTAGSELTNNTVVGHSVGGLFVVPTNGVDPQTGRRIFINAAGKEVELYYELTGGPHWQYRDGSGNAPAIDQGTDGKIMGSGIPKVFGGLDNNLTFHNFDFGLNLTYALGFDLYNGTKAGLRDQRWWNNSVEVYNTYWRKPGDITDIAKPIWGDNRSNGHTALPESSMIEKGDYLKIRNLSIGYTIKKLPAITGIEYIRVYAQIFNLHTFTKYTGSDPEISTNGDTSNAPGVDRNSAPQARTYTMGISINF